MEEADTKLATMLTHTLTHFFLQAEPWAVFQLLYF